MKSSIDIRHLRRTIVFKPIDAYLVPVASYGCQLWLPETFFVKNHQHHTSSQCTLKKIAQDPLEELHLSFLRRTLGVGRKTSNASVWGDTGRYPLAFVVSKQVFAYTDKLEQPDRNDDDILVRHTYIEQRELNLSWFRSLYELRTNL